MPDATTRRFSAARTSRSPGRVLIGVFTASVLAGCAERGPQMFPVAPRESRRLPDGRSERCYDTEGDGRIDYCEQMSRDGIVRVLRYDTDRDGQFDLDVDLAAIPLSERRDLVILLDSVPYEMVRDLWESGRFRYFPRPTRVIAPFPVMTDLSFSEFMGTSPSPGVESEYFDGRRLTNGFETYAAGGNAGWQAHLDYRVTPVAHGAAYLDSYTWNLHDLGEIERHFLRDEKRCFIGYVVGTAALGAQYGRSGHQAGLVEVDRFCESLMFRTRGRVRLTLLSDHGRNSIASQQVKLDEVLAHMGYRVADRIDGPADVVVPQFGVVCCAAIHTHCPERVAADVTGIEGIGCAAYRDAANDDIIVLGRHARARISRRTGNAPGAASGNATDDRVGQTLQFRYKAEIGDPLQLAPILEKLTLAGHVSGDGFVDDRVLFEATESHIYPDAVYRLWRAFHGLIEHTPDVLVSIDDGWVNGSRLMSAIRPMAATHGNLGHSSSYAFALTAAGDLPPVVRMEDLRSKLIDLGVPLNFDGTDGELFAESGR